MTKPINIFTCCAGIFYLLLFPHYIIAQNTRDPQVILSDALRLEREAASIHTVEIHKDGDFISQIEIFKKTAPDGSTFKRMEEKELLNKNPRKGGLIEVAEVWNADGHWVLKDKKAFLKQFEAKEEKIVYAIDPSLSAPPFDSKCQYRMSDTSHQGKPCFKIIVTLPDGVYQSRLDNLQQAFDAVTTTRNLERKSSGVKDDLPPRNASESLAYVYEYVIQKDPYMIWAVKPYTKTGNLINVQQHEFTSVEVNLPLSDEIFAVPKGWKIYNCTTFQDFINSQTN